MLFSLLPVFTHLNLWPLSLLLTFEVLWKHRPHLSLHPVIYGCERRLDACGGICRVGAGVLTAGRLRESHSRPEGEDGMTADWVSRADSRRHGWKEASCSTVSSHSLIDFGSADVHKDNVRLRLAAVISISHVFEHSISILKRSRFLLKWWSQSEGLKRNLHVCPAVNKVKMCSIKTSCPLCFHCSRANSALLRQPALGSL